MHRRIDAAALLGFFDKKRPPRWRARRRHAAIALATATAIWAFVLVAIVSATLQHPNHTLVRSARCAHGLMVMTGAPDIDAALLAANRRHAVAGAVPHAARAFTRARADRA
ncbi:MAG TPA: hypothetical protein VFQ57_04000 [Sphingomonas sp.]|jgi:hypothetical protein|nr:hypothetical protein [Sphingomonas sp.]